MLQDHGTPPSEAQNQSLSRSSSVGGLYATLQRPLKALNPFKAASPAVNSPASVKDASGEGSKPEDEPEGEPKPRRSGRPTQVPLRLQDGAPNNGGKKKKKK